MIGKKHSPSAADVHSTRPVSKDRLLACAHCVCGGLANNVAARRLLGLCPLLALTHSLLKAMAIGVLLLLVSVLSACLGSILRSTIFWRFKPIYFALLASLATIICVNAVGILFPLLVDTLGIYALLLAANCLVIAQLQEVAEHAALRNVVSRVTKDGVWILLFLAVIATIRELGAFGRVFHDIAIIHNLPVINEVSRGLSILADPAGALIILALLLALINGYDSLRLGAARKQGGEPDTAAEILNGDVGG